MPNRYSQIVQPEPLITANNYLFKRPANIPWNLISPSFSPGLGQSIRIRETYRFSAISNQSTTVYSNNNRYLPNTNIGYWQHLYIDNSGEYIVEREGQMDCPVLYGNSGLITHTSSYEWDYKLFRAYKDFLGSVYGSVDACNADLEPAAVPNGFIENSNVVDYVKITRKLASGNFLGAASDLLELVDPTTQGFRFPDKKNLFTVYNQLPVVDLEAYSLPTAIGDIGIYLNPGFDPVACLYEVQVREFGVLVPLENQLAPATCTYLPGFKYQFSGTAISPCQAEFQNFIATSQGQRFTTAGACNAAIIAGTTFGGTCIPLTHICPSDSTVTNTYWIGDAV